MSNFKPMLASPVEFDKLRFPTLVSPKLDGIRAIIIDGVVMSRNLKPIPNQFVQDIFGKTDLNHFDGELIVGSPTSPTVYRDTNSAVMSAWGTPDVYFHVFDHVEFPDRPYPERIELVEKRLVETDAFDGLVWIVPQRHCESMERLRELELQYLEQGYEGVMLRHPSGADSLYKHGRATAKSNTLLKLKRFTDAEAMVIGLIEEMSNNNEATIDALGRTKRSSHQENKEGKGRLGALLCETTEGVRFKIGTGFDAAQREDIWAQREAYLGRLVKFKFFNIGVKEAPRFPVFLGWRDPIDA